MMKAEEGMKSLGFIAMAYQPIYQSYRSSWTAFNQVLSVIRALKAQKDLNQNREFKARFKSPRADGKNFNASTFTDALWLVKNFAISLKEIAKEYGLGETLEKFEKDYNLTHQTLYRANAGARGKKHFKNLSYKIRHPSKGRK